MPESQKSHFITDSTLNQLLDVDSQLSAQETYLQNQLASIQEKRQSLQVVINLFSQAEPTNTVILTKETTSTLEIEQQSELVEKKQTILKPKSQELSIAAVPKPKKETKTASKKEQARKTQKSKTTKQSPGWQQYLRDSFRNYSLPQAISAVLESEVERVWDSSTVVEAIFLEEIPQEIQKKVRLQINNLLASGVKENKWYRGQQGSYTLSKQAAKV